MNLVPGPNAGHGRLVLLAPPNVVIPGALTGVESNLEYRGNVLAQLQRLRGQTYFEDGAIDASELESDGRYVQEVDAQAWHLVSLNVRGEVCGCARYITHPNGVRFADTTVSRAPISRDVEWASRFRGAVDSQIELAGRLGLACVEVGGWALTPELRCTADALRIALGMFSLARILGGCIGLTTATRRHCSASILRRIGGQALVWQGDAIPSYFDPRYNCQMEVLRFDSSRPNPRFELWIEDLRRHLSGISVISANTVADQLRRPASVDRPSEMTAA